jgi:glycosyltransferase involved in cell wall biosynthesis
LIRESIPWRLRAPVRRTRNRLAAARLVARQGRRWRAIAATPPRRDRLAVWYGAERMPGAADVVFGGAVKFQLLNRALPNASRDFNLLYLGSSSLPVDASMLVRLARRRNAVFAWNQNGVAYPGWHGDGWELVNAPRARLLHESDWVFFQSTFCKLAADRFYGARDDRFDVLHNPVDVEAFTPARAPERRPLTLLVGGNQYQHYRVESALGALAAVRRECPDARLLIAGELSFASDAAAQTAAMIRALDLDGAVELCGTYTQRDAPALFHRADVLLHPKYNDPCPSVVLEAMACALPVVYSASGGTPELVGSDAGIGIPAPLDWEHDWPPPVDALANAILTVAGELPGRAAAAREQALRFDARKWVERHRQVFAKLAEARAILDR